MSQTSVLLIDDEQSLLEGLRVFLEDEGYDVHLSTNGNEALAVFEEVSPELVVTDLRMPGISGIEVIRGIKKLRRDAVIIVLTGYGSMEAAVEAIRLDVFDFISKPIDLDQFKASLDRARDSIREALRAKQETKLMREQLALAKNHLDSHQQDMEKQKALAAAGRLMPAMLHNLNNPLSYIMGETQILQLVHPEMKVFEKIDQQACRMAQIIRSFLRKMEQSETCQEKWLDLNQILIEEVSFLESHPYFQIGLEKEWHLEDRLPLIKGFVADFAQVFGNLLFNAAEAMHDQAVRKLILRTCYDDYAITIAVEDNGPGIPTELQDRIFEPFFSTKGTKRGISGSVGTGLGLYSCRQILHEYGAAIEVVSNPGEGTRFAIHIPRHL
ncbi:MAG: hybrid sensor histidine kinase/response regulator [Syntrophobacteraceae bacterium]